MHRQFFNRVHSNCSRLTYLIWRYYVQFIRPSVYTQPVRKEYPNRLYRFLKKIHKLNHRPQAFVFPPYSKDVVVAVLTLIILDIS